MRSVTKKTMELARGLCLTPAQAICLPEAISLAASILGGSEAEMLEFAENEPDTRAEIRRVTLERAKQVGLCGADYAECAACAALSGYKGCCGCMD